MHEKPGDNVLAKTLAGYRVLDLTDSTGVLCIRTLAGMGAQINRADPEKERERFVGQIKKTDYFIETCPPGRLDSLGLGYKNLAEINPRLIMISITPFGQTGPYKDLKASDAMLQAMGGWMSVTGTPDQPLKLYGNQAYNTASLFAVNGALLALYRRYETGKGGYIDISVLECVAATLDHVLVRYFSDGAVSGRQGSRAWNNAFDILPCADGYVLISVHRQWETLVELMAADGMAEDLPDPKYLDRKERDRNIDHIIAVMERWTRRHKARELEELGQLMHFPWAAVKNA